MAGSSAAVFPAAADRYAGYTFPAKLPPMRRTANVLLLTLSISTSIGLLIPATSTAANQQNLLDVFKRYSSNTSVQPGNGALTPTDLVAGLKQALAQGTMSAITQLGRTDGFWKDARAQIPLPGSIGRFEGTLRTLGYGKKLDKFHLTLNRAAEQAVPQVVEVFAGSLTKMTIADAQSILLGPKDAATQFFRRTSSTELYSRIFPIVQTATTDVGVTQKYKALVEKAGPVMRLSGTQATDLDSFVTQKALDSLFLKIADEEARIRVNPAARGTELLQKVFSRQ